MKGNRLLPAIRRRDVQPELDRISRRVLALDFERQPLASEWGAPVRLRIPTKLGFKSAKNLQEIEVTNIYPGGFWENQGYDWFAGV